MRRVVVEIRGNRCVVRGLTQEELELAKKAEEDYERYDKEFEERVGRFVPEEFCEANFWVEGEEVIFDEGW